MAGIRSPCGERWISSERIFFITPQVQGLYRDREEHGEIDISFRNVDVETFQNQRKTDQNQKRERQHFHRRVAIDKLTNRASSKHHHAYGNHHRRHHDKQMIGQTNRSNHGIQTEDNV